MLRQTTAGLNSRPTPSPATLTTTETSSSEPDTSGGTDSGYASQVTTPGKGTPEASSDHTFVHKVILPPPKLFQRKVTRLRPFDTEIPEAVRNRFCDLKELFDIPLYEYLSKERVSVGSIAMRLKVLGKTEKTAKPWVVVLCDQSISKLVKQYFNQPQVKEQFQTCNTDPELPSLDILIHDKPPKPRAVVEFDGVDEYTNANTNLTLCGTLIKASSSNGYSAATLGGIVKVSYTSERSMLYGMTVGHLFTDDRSETHTSILSGAEDDSRSDIADDGNSDADITDEFILDLDFEEGDATLEAEAAIIQPEAPADPTQNSSWSRLGYGIVPVSTQCAPVAHRNLDWALVDIEDKARYQPNLLPSPYGIPSVELRQLSNSEACISEKKVVVVSGRNELKQGNLSSFASFLLLAPGSTFLQTYTLTLTDGSDIRDGDSGSWVVDESTHEVYGYLVASDVFQDGYVIPLDASLQDMKTQLSAESVCLPTRDEVYSWHASEWHGKHTNHLLYPRPRSMLSAFSPNSSQGSTQSPSEVHLEDTPVTVPETLEDLFKDPPEDPLDAASNTMSNNPSQPDWAPDISEFMRWVETQSVMGTLGPVSAVNCPFMPLRRLQKYLKEGNRTRRLLEALFPNRELPVGPEDIWRHCIKVFSILLLIGKGSFIQHFVQHDQLWDVKLPFTSRPPQFPPSTGNDNFFESFSKRQWRFCPCLFSYNEIKLEKECILPIIYKEQLGDGGSALTYKIKLHPEYDDLTPKTDIRQDSSHRYAKTYVLKTYRSNDAEEHYTSEVKAFKALIPGGSLGKSIIGFYGSFVQDGWYNVLLEFADRGTLDHYLDTTSPPTTGEDVYRLWSALFNVVKALKSIHDVQQTDPKDPPILQGWHQDVKPSNILVVSGKSGSRFDCEFKLADLGLSHFRRISTLHRTNSDKDTSGTCAYGAPECYRFDQFMEQTPLFVKQTVDIWSLGCVYSEVAVWIVHGKDRLEEYRKMRQAETEQIYDFKDAGCFHNSQDVLQSVGSMHEEVFDNVRTSDYVTKSVVKKMITEMLYEVDGRPTSKQLWTKSQNILKEAEKKLKQSKTTQPETDPFAPVNRSQTFGHPRGRMPPVLPPGIQYSQSDRISPNDTPKPWSPDTGQQRERLATMSQSREDTPSPESNIEDPYETPDEVSHPTSSPATSPPDAHGPNYSHRRRVTSTGYNHQPASPEQLGEADDPSWNKSSTSHGKARYRNSNIPRTRVTDQIQGRSLTETISGLNIGNHPESSPEPARVEVPDNSHVEPNPSKSQIAQKQTATMIDASPHTKKPVPRQIPHHLAVAKAEQWIYNKKHRQSFTTLENKVYLNALAQRDHVFLVDDAASMRPYWNDVTSVLHVLAYMLKGCDKDGMDLYFTISTSKYNSKNSTGLLQPIEGKSLQGTSDIGSRLSSILHGYETALRRHETRKWVLFGPKAMKPLNVYILTDALWQPQSDAAGPIRSMVETLVDLHYPRQQVGIQFIQFGKNLDCARKLERLDSGLGLPMDIVDAEAADGNVWKMLLGAVNKWFDGDEALGE